MRQHSGSNRKKGVSVGGELKIQEIGNQLSNKALTKTGWYGIVRAELRKGKHDVRKQGAWTTGETRGARSSDFAEGTPCDCERKRAAKRTPRWFGEKRRLSGKKEGAEIKAKNSGITGSGCRHKKDKSAK